MSTKPEPVDDKATESVERLYGTLYRALDERRTTWQELSDLARENRDASAKEFGVRESTKNLNGIEFTTIDMNQWANMMALCRLGIDMSYIADRLTRIEETLRKSSSTFSR